MSRQLLFPCGVIDIATISWSSKILLRQIGSDAIIRSREQKLVHYISNLSRLKSPEET